MAQTEKVIVPIGGNVQGNIGSCEIKTTSIDLSSFYKQTIAVNSCNGEIVSSNSYYDWGYIYFPLMVVGMVLGIIKGVMYLSDK